MTFGIYGMIFLLPLVWQASRLLGPETAGLALLPCALVFFLVSQRSGHLAQRVWRARDDGGRHGRHRAAACWSWPRRAQASQWRSQHSGWR
jgi:hypothetical protein